MRSRGRCANPRTHASAWPRRPSYGATDLPCRTAVWRPWLYPLLLMRIRDHGATSAASQNGGEPARIVDRKHNDRDGVLARQRDGGRIHHLQITRQHLVIGQMLITLRIRHALR